MRDNPPQMGKVVDYIARLEAHTQTTECLPYFCDLHAGCRLRQILLRNLGDPGRGAFLVRREELGRCRDGEKPAEVEARVAVQHKAAIIRAAHDEVGATLRFLTGLHPSCPVGDNPVREAVDNRFAQKNNRSKLRTGYVWLVIKWHLSSKNVPHGEGWILHFHVGLLYPREVF